MRVPKSKGIIHDSPNDHYLVFSHCGRSLTPSCARSGKRITKKEQSFAKRTLRTQSQVEMNKINCHCIYKLLLNVSNDKIYRFKSSYGHISGVRWATSVEVASLFRNAASLFQVRPVPKARHHPRHRRPGFLGLVQAVFPFVKSSALSPLLSTSPGEVTVGLFEPKYARRFLLSQILPAKFHKWIARHGG
jgi:hypothetical protein